MAPNPNEGGYAASGRGAWIQTYTGRAFHFLDPSMDEISIIDIAHSLATQVRFTGHCVVPYHIADHCVRVAEEVEKVAPEFALEALFHDASEAYLVDLPRPLKHGTPIGPPYLEIEANIERAIARKFNLVWPMPPIVKEFDNRLLVTEKRDLLPESGLKWPPSLETIEPLAARVIARDWQTAKRDFLKMASRLILQSYEAS